MGRLQPTQPDSDATPRGRWSEWRRAVLTSLAAVALFRVVTQITVMLAHDGPSFGDALRRGDVAGAVLAPWARWDTGWWTNIADHGYFGRFDPHQDSTAFAPAYPITVRAVTHVLPVSSLVAALLVSTLCLVVALAVLYRLVETRWGAHAAATTITVVLVYPGAFFLAAAYSEPMSLAAVALAMYGMQRRRWWLAGVAAAVAGVSKYFLLLVAVAVLAEWVMVCRRQGRRLAVRDGVAIVVPTVVLLGGWMAYMQAKFGDPLHFLKAERTAWQHGFTSPTDVIGYIVQTIQHPGMRHPWPFTDFLDDAAIVAALAMAAWMLWRWRHEVGWTVIMVLSAVVLLCMTVPDSAARYLLAVAPFFVVVGVAASRRPWLERALIFCGAPLMLLQLTHLAQNVWTG
jgi:hypothetical protein